MSINSTALLKKYYLYNTDSFLSYFNGLNVGKSGQIDKNLIQKVIEEITIRVCSISNSTVAQMDMDGNVLFSSSEANFAKTKADLKSFQGTVEKFNKDYVLVADTRNKRAIIWKIDYVTMSDIINDSDLNADEKRFFSDFFETASSIIGVYNPCWEYKSNCFVTSLKIIEGDLINEAIEKYNFLICENDGLAVPFSSRIINVDFSGNVNWAFGEGYLINPQKALPLDNGNVLINT
jgi:hypothetical protein